MNNQPLKALGIDAGQYNVRSLFDKFNCKSKEQALQRVKAVLKICSSWINNSDNIGTNIYDLINSQLSPYYNFSQFQTENY